MGWLQEVRNRVEGKGWLQGTIKDALAKKGEQAIADKQSKLDLEKQQREAEMGRLRPPEKEGELKAQLDSLGAESLLEDVRQAVRDKGKIKYAGLCPYAPAIEVRTPQGRGIRPRDLPIRGAEVALADKDGRNFLGIAVLDIDNVTKREHAGASSEGVLWGKYPETETPIAIIRYAFNRGRPDENILDEHDQFNIPTTGYFPDGKYILLRSRHKSRGEGSFYDKEELIPFSDENREKAVKDFLKADCNEWILNHQPSRGFRFWQ